MKYVSKRTVGVASITWTLPKSDWWETTKDLMSKTPQSGLKGANNYRQEQSKTVIVSWGIHSPKLISAETKDDKGEETPLPPPSTPGVESRVTETIEPY